MPEKDTENMKKYDDYSVEELRAELQRYFQYSDLDDEAVDEMEQILAVLREKAPFHHPHTTEEMWSEFRSEHTEEFAELGIRKNEDAEEVIDEEPKVDVIEKRSGTRLAAAHSRRGRRFLRAVMVAAAMVVFIIAATVTASAMGYNLWGWLPKWDSELLSFESESPQIETNSISLHGIPSVLTSLGIDEPLYPTWLPDDMARTEYVFEEDPFILHEAYSGNDRFLSITISPSSGSETAKYQKLQNPPTEYENSNVVHYIFDNSNNLQAVWNTGAYSTVIAGNITLDEMKRIIDSVYEVR